LCYCEGIPLKDTRLTRDEFVSMKSSGKLKLGQVPALISDGTQICQSNAIMRYLGKLTGLYPADNIAAANVDMLLDEEIDMFMGLSCATYRERFGFGSLDDHTATKCREDVANEVLPRHLGFLEKILESYANDGGSVSGWLANTKGPSIVDFVYAPRLQWLKSGLNNIPTTIIDPYPRVMAFLERFYAHPKIAEYYASRS